MLSSEVQIGSRHLLICFVLDNGEHQQIKEEHIRNRNIDEKSLEFKKIQVNIHSNQDGNGLSYILFGNSLNYENNFSGIPSGNLVRPGD